MEKIFYFTIDLEEWYHLLYFEKTTKLRGQDFFIFHTESILEFLDHHQIKCTFFVLGEIAQKYPELILQIYNKGHEISCHGYNHQLVTKKKIVLFINELIKAKKILEEIIDDKVLGYRAPCFSLTNEALENLDNIGFRYDSSYIKFTRHRLYNELKLSSFSRVNSIILKSHDFFEFEIPTLKLLGINLPISGGGYIRIIPWFLFRLLFKREIKKRNEFMLFTHPFELYPKPFKLPIKTSLLNRLRFHYCRKKNLKKIGKLIKIIKMEGYEFKLLKESI